MRFQREGWGRACHVARVTGRVAVRGSWLTKWLVQREAVRALVGGRLENIRAMSSLLYLIALEMGSRVPREPKSGWSTVGVRVTGPVLEISPWRVSVVGATPGKQRYECAKEAPRIIQTSK